MSLKIRLNEIVNFSDHDPTNFAKQFKSVGIETIRKILKHENPNPSFEFIAELFSLYPTISYKWFFFGQGSMLISNNYESDKENHFANNEEESPTYECKNPGCKKRIADLEEDKKVLREFNLNLQQQLKKETGLENSAQVGQYAKRNKTAGT